VPRLSRRRDDLGVIAIRKYRPPPPRPRPALADRRVEVLGGGDLEALHPRRERGLVVCLDDQVDVRALDACVHDPEVLAPRSGERRFADRLVDAPPAQVADRSDDSQRDVHGIPRMQKRPLPVR